MQIASPRTLTDLNEIRDAEMLFDSSKTCWWTTNPNDLCDETGFPTPPGARQDSLPLDPSGAPLFQSDDVKGFLQKCEEDAQQYGKHGIEAFILAYHGNVLSDEGFSSCAVKWDLYNNLLDENS